MTGVIPDNSVAIGTPAKVIYSVNEYYQKRKEKALCEAKEYALSIREKLNREPVETDFFEEFGLFVDKSNYDQQQHRYVKRQMGKHFNKWISTHQSEFKDFNSFMQNL